MSKHVFCFSSEYAHVPDTFFLHVFLLSVEILIRPRTFIGVFFAVMVEIFMCPWNVFGVSPKYNIVPETCWDLFCLSKYECSRKVLCTSSKYDFLHLMLFFRSITFQNVFFFYVGCFRRNRNEWMCSRNVCVVFWPNMNAFQKGYDLYHVILFYYSYYTSRIDFLFVPLHYY